jgi:serine/threonine-protein kinase
MEKEPYISRFDRYHLLQIFVKVCDAVSFAHSNDVIHCDIKPANIMVGPFGEVLLTDWGIACDLNDPIQSPESPGRSVVRGTPAYMAPEMAESRALEIDKLTDIFLMGATLYHIITQEPPYVGPNTWNVAYKAARCDFPHPSERRPDLQIPSELSRIVLKTMALKKSDRYQSVEELKRDLEIFLAGNSRAAQRKYLPGDILIRAGDRGTEAYLIIAGCVEVVKKTENGQPPLVLATLGPGDIVGEMALVTGEVRSANVVAREETLVEIITLEQMKTELKKLAPWMEKMVIALADRLRETDARIKRS